MTPVEDMETGILERIEGFATAFAALVIEDDAFTRKTMSLALTRIGARLVHEAGDGAEAVALAGRHGTIDVILCDLNMPVVDGVETLRQLAEHYRQALVILVSSADARVLRAAREAALGYGLATVRIIPKPVTVTKLRTAIGPPGTETQPRRSEMSAVITVDELDRALSGAELVAYYQPKVTFADRRLAGVEALVRWQHPIHGLLSPRDFMPLAERLGRLEALTNKMLATAIAQCADWRRDGIIIGVSVNLPMVSLISRALPAQIGRLLADYELVPDRLTLEVTEDGWLQQQAIARETLTRLRVHGFGLSIDDFGTGYSTHQQLLNAPFNELKLDQSFVSRVLQDDESRIVLESTVQLAHQLDLTVVAEGVETQAQWDLLSDLGCDVAQGYLIAPPLPGSALPAWKADWDSSPPLALRA